MSEGNAIGKISLNIEPCRHRVKPDKTEAGAVRNRLCDSAAAGSFTGDQICTAICEGRSITAGMMVGTESEDWRCQQLLIADIDNTVKVMDGKKKKLVPAPHMLTYDDILKLLSDHQLEPAFIYSTFSSQPDHPKFRVAVELEHGISDPDQMQRLIRKYLGIFPNYDHSCTDLSRIFYGASGKDKMLLWYTGKRVSAEAIEALPDPDADPKDPKTTQSRRKKPVPGTEKSRCIGSWCKVHDCYWVMDRLIENGIYEADARDSDRFLYKGSSSGIPGLWIRDEGQSAFSFSDSDPASTGHQLNSYDLHRIGFFGDDKESYKKMNALVMSDPECARIVNEELHLLAVEDFDDGFSDEETPLRLNIGAQCYAEAPTSEELEQIRTEVCSHEHSTSISEIDFEKAICECRFFTAGCVEGTADSDWIEQSMIFLIIDNMERDPETGKLGPVSDPLFTDDIYFITSEHNLTDAYVYETYGSSPQLHQLVISIALDRTIKDRNQMKRLIRKFRGLFSDYTSAEVGLTTVFPGSPKGKLFSGFEGKTSVSAVEALPDPHPEEDDLLHEEEQDPAGDSSDQLDMTKYHLYNAQGQATGVFDYGIFADIVKTHHMFVLGDVPYLYDHGCYYPDVSGTRLKTMIKKRMYQKYVRSPTIERVYKLFLQASELTVSFYDLNQQPAQWINFQNGFYDPISHTLKPHSAKYLSTNQLDLDYRPEDWTHGEHVEDFLQRAVPDSDDREMLLQYTGLCMNADQRFQRFLFIHGRAGTGKSTLLRLISSVLGNDNICAVDIWQLSERFMPALLIGKMADIFDDCRLSAIKDSSILKVCTGEGALTAEHKNKTPFRFEPRNKFIFCGNALPLIKGESTNAIYRRMLALEMHQLPPGADIDLGDALKSERGYFVGLCIKALERCYAAKKITESANSLAAKEQLQDSSDGVAAFIRACCDESCQTVKTQRSKLYAEYENYMEAYKRQPLGKNAFYRSLEEKGFKAVKVHGDRLIEGLCIDEEHLKEALESEGWHLAGDSAPDFCDD